MRPLLLLLTLATAGTAHAADCRKADARTERAAFGTSMGMVGAGAGLFLTARFVEEQQGAGTWIPPVDRGVPSVYDEDPASSSDILLGVGLGAGAAGMLASTFACGPKGETGFTWATPLAEGAGTFFAVWGTTDIVKKAVGRPRPYTRSGTFLDPEDDYESFFSGHTSLSSWGFTHGAAELLRVADVPWWGRAIAGFGVGTAGGLATGSQRVASGKHYWSDVLVGWGVGTTIGLIPTLLDPAWDRMAEKRIAVSGTATTEGAGLTVSGVW